MENDLWEEVKISILTSIWKNLIPASMDDWRFQEFSGEVTADVENSQRTRFFFFFSRGGGLGKAFPNQFLFYLFIYFWLCWVFVSARGLSPVVASGGHSSSRCAGLSLSRPLLLQSTGSRRAGSAVVAHRPSCSAACRILPDQGSNPRPLH